MLTANNILTVNGEPVVVSFHEFRADDECPRAAWYMAIPAPEGIQERMAESMKASAEHFAKAMYGEEIPDDVQEAIDETLENLEIADHLGVDEPFTLCWN